MTSDPDKELARAQQFIDALPHAQALGMRINALGDGHAAISMPYDARLVGDPETGVIHGGAVSALMDTCAGAAVMSHPSAPVSTATLDLRIDYMRPAKPGCDITAEAHCLKSHGLVAFVRATAHDGDADDPVAIAQAAFMISGASKAAHKRAYEAFKEAKS